MSSALTSVTLTFEMLREAIADASPATLDVAAKDVQWIMQHDENHNSVSHWVAECIKIGAVAKKRSIEYTLATRAAKKQAEESAKNVEQFAKFLLTSPETLHDLPKLLKVAASYQIPTNLVLDYYTKNQPAPAEAPAK